MSTHTTNPSNLEGGLFADRGGSVVACSIAFIVLCTLSLTLRFISLHIGRRPTSLEDWLMIPAWVLLMGLCTNVILSVKLGGVGRHQAYILKYDRNAMTSWSQTLFVTELLYGILMALEKTTILLLYLRLFKIQRWFRITTYILLVFIWMWGISESLVAIFQCKPIELQWNKKLHGTCINQLAYYRYVRVPNLIHDMVMLVLPLPVIWKLQIALQQKIALLAIFLLGSMGFVSSLVSLILFFKLDAFSDATWASIQLMSWTLAEPGVIFICSCLPALWPLIALFLPRISTSQDTGRVRSGYSRQKELDQYDSENSYSGNNDSVPLKSFTRSEGVKNIDSSHNPTA